jgi:hypothetical protein
MTMDQASKLKIGDKVQFRLWTNELYPNQWQLGEVMSVHHGLSFWVDICPMEYEDKCYRPRHSVMESDIRYTSAN